MSRKLMSRKLEILSVPGTGPLMERAAGDLEALSTAGPVAHRKREADLLSSWLSSDSPFRSDSWARINWSAVFGVGLATVVSIGIWTGIALAIASIWK